MKSVRSLKLLMLASLAAFAVGCGDEEVSYSILEEEDTFLQTSKTVHQQIDILWVIDNSGSMVPSQENIALNFNRFISRFVEKNYDYQIAVTTTEAYYGDFAGDNTYSRFRDGTDETSHTGVFVITPSTLNPIETFMVNILQGAQGRGDERGFQSMKATLDNPLNQPFFRGEGAFLSVIFVTDEEDFSYDGTDILEIRDEVHPVSQYLSYLDQFTNSTTQQKNYSASAIAIFDEQCRDYLNDNDPNGWVGRKLALRYGEIVDASDGIKGSVCSEFGDTLDLISENIATNSTQFFLSRIPILSSIEVSVDGISIPEDEINGWTYSEKNNSIVFHGSAIPKQGAKIQIHYDPTSLKEV